MLHSRLDNLSLKFFPEEHELLKKLRELILIERPIAICVSGGRDSVLLLHVFSRINRVLKLPLYVLHVHHGNTSSRRQTEYRHRVQNFVIAESKKLNIEILTNKPKLTRLTRLKVHQSEANLRDIRKKQINKWCAQLKKKFKTAPIVVYAHHADDLLETQFMRLLRGTSFLGLQSMTEFDGEVLRPFLDWSVVRIDELSKKLKLRWYEDPSNQNTDYLRNWLRHECLVQIEKKMPGARASMTRTFRLLLEEWNDAQKMLRASESQLNESQLILERSHFLALSRVERRHFIVRYLRALNIFNYTQGHVEEICRQLDNRRGRFTFTVLKHKWHVNAGRIRAKKISP